MKKSYLLVAGLGLAASGPYVAKAQSIDPGFASPTMYGPGTVLSAVEQPDGKRVITGLYNRVDGTPAWGVSRFSPNGALDAAFQQNVGTSAFGYRIRLLSNGQFLVLYPGNASSSPLTVGGISRTAILRLNADGTGDASFDAGTGPGVSTTTGGAFIDDALPLPNGQTLVVGAFDRFNGAAANCIVRLTASGAVDPTFNSGTGADPLDDIERIVALPNGQFLASGYITTYNGVPCNSLIRLNADGSLDASFVPGIGASVIDNLLVQPDGRIVVAGNVALPPFGPSQGLVRLMPNGAVDASFSPPPITPYSVSSRFGDAMQLQPDGKLLIISFPGTIPQSSGIARLNANGSLDTSFQAGTGPNQAASSINLLANGKILVEGGFTNFNGTLDRPLVQLTSTGAVDPAFQPLIQTSGSVSTLARQSDGKLVVGGDFSEVNGQVARRLARFNPDGTLDAAFSAGTGLNDQVRELALQPDGKVLTVTDAAVQRFQPNGAPDNGFTPPSFAGSHLYHLLLQADGRVLVGGTFMNQNGTVLPLPFARLLADGSADASFTPPSTGAGRFTSFQAVAQQPDGKLLVAGRFAPTAASASYQTVMRLNSTGAVDASFTGSPFARTGSGFATLFYSLAVQPDGKILVGGVFDSYGGTARANLARLETTGTLDAGFVPPSTTGTVSKVLVQPNNRVLVAGSFTGTGLPANLARLLPSGQADTSFGSTAVPNNRVVALLIQPDGKLVLGGSFTTLSGQPAQALARIAAPNVLHVAAPAAVAARTEAWPVPARTTLTVVPDASAHPQFLDLLDALGRPVRQQVLTGTTEISVENLPVGLYLLRVGYSEGTVVRRIQIK